MRAAFYDQTGDSSVIRIGELDMVVPGPGEVRVRVAVSGANSSDALRRSGLSGPMFHASYPTVTEPVLSMWLATRRTRA